MLPTPVKNDEANFSFSLDRALVTTAISASSALEPTNYQRLEFLGDSILKLSTSLALVATHLKYHESILSKMKDHVVSNGSLARAATRTGLDRFIVTKAFTGAKWRPLHVSELLGTSDQPPRHREMSTKVLVSLVRVTIYMLKPRRHAYSVTDDTTPQALNVKR